MRILSAKVENFASYNKLELPFTHKRLTLISGATGSGKSTLCDIVPWILFGRTAKGGAVDEVLSWNSNGPTTGTIVLEVPKRLDPVAITRIRSKSKDNDLYFSFDGGASKVRGKDLTDTQEVINNMLLYMDVDLYLSGAYFHEFSQTAQFFTTTAKIRRQITEQIVDLTLPKTLSDNIARYTKDVSKELNDLRMNLGHNDRNLLTYQNTGYSIMEESQEWEVNQKEKIKRLKKSHTNFEKDKQDEIDRLTAEYIKTESNLQHDIEILQKSIKSDQYFIDAKKVLDDQMSSLGDIKCDSCGALKNNDKRLIITRSIYGLQNEESHNNRIKIQLTVAEQALQRHRDPNGAILKQITAEQKRENTYEGQLQDLETNENPHTKLYNDTKAKEQEAKKEIQRLESDIAHFVTEENDLELLLSVIADMRKEMIRDTIKSLEKATNGLLNKHFDAEIRVVFSADTADKLDIEIYKDGNTCVYSQLSKGQRQLLKLCFGISVMESVANRHGIDFSCVFLDEALDGLDDRLKVKAYGLLQDLAMKHESVFVVEHNNDLKSMFTNKYEVELVNGSSEIREM